MTTNRDRILLVDDDQDLLDGLCLHYRKLYTLFPARSGLEGLQAIEEEGPFAVVVSDYRMPGMNGSQFLARARERDPDMVRIMLTGQADLRTAVDAVNRGQIFRFLTKPCEPEILRGCLDAALEHCRLHNAERDLLEQTVRGSIEVLADVLALANPTAFGKAMRIRGLVRHIVQHLELENAWQYETAALLSQIGCVAIPDDLVDRMAAGEVLPAEQRAMFKQHPEVARDLLVKIPRLQDVAEMVHHQQLPAKPSEDRAIVLGGRMLAAALDFDQHLSAGDTHKQALDALRKTGGKYDEDVLEALATAEIRSTTDVAQVVPVHELEVGMVIRDEVRNTDGILIVRGGHEVSEGSRQRLRNYAQLGRLQKVVFRVHMPQAQTTLTR